jgi:hypothetical protein
MNIDKRNNIISVILTIAILVLGYVLYRSITAPWEEVKQREKVTELVRHRMGNVRTALVEYQRNNNRFPATLDSLVVFLKTNDRMRELGDSLLREPPPLRYSPDSLIYSPRPPHNRFEYELNDTLRPMIYLLSDPDSRDHIGSLERTTLLNASSWE